MAVRMAGAAAGVAILNEEITLLPEGSSLLSNYQPHWSLANWKYAGCAALVKRGCALHAVRCSLSNSPHDAFPQSSQEHHHREGRVMLLEFDRFHLLSTYSPNNGSSIDPATRSTLAPVRYHFGQASPQISSLLTGMPRNYQIVMAMTVISSCYSCQHVHCAIPSNGECSHRTSQRTHYTCCTAGSPTRKANAA